MPKKKKATPKRGFFTNIIILARVNTIKFNSYSLYCTQFEIVGMAEDNGHGFSGAANWDGLNSHCVINGKNMFKRIFIKKVS